MNRLIIDSSSNTDLLYITGFNAPDPFIYFSVDDKDYIIVNQLEYSRAKSESKESIEVLLINDLLEKEGKPGIENILTAIIRKYDIKEFSVPFNFSVKYADYIRSMGIRITVLDNPFFPEREVKSEDEISKIRDACNVVAKAMGRAEGILTESNIGNDGILIWSDEVLTSEILQTEINMEIVRHGAIGSHTIAASGIQSSQPHNIGSGPISANVPIVVDIFPRVDRTGYWGDMTRTFVKGKAPEIVKKAYKTLYDVKSQVMAEIHAGVIPAQVQATATKLLAEKGFPTGKNDTGYYGFIHSLGHGVGLDIHEKPHLGLLGKDPLKINSTVTVEPGLYYTEWGGIRLEDLVLVKEDNVEKLTIYPEKLEIA